MGKSSIGVELIMNAVAVGQAGTKYSSSLPFERCSGSAALLIKSTAGSITVSQQCSVDDVAWYDPIDAAGSAQGVILSAQGVTTGIYVVFTPVLTSYIRYKVVEGNSAATVVTLELVMRVEV